MWAGLTLNFNILFFPGEPCPGSNMKSGYSVIDENDDDPFSDYDDLDKDPTFKLGKQNDCDSDENECNTSIEEMAQRLERNLTQTDNSSNIKPSTSRKYSDKNDLDKDSSFELREQNDCDSDKNECDTSIEEMAQQLERNLTQTDNIQTTESFKSRQKKRNNGKQYFTKSGKLVEERKIITFGGCRMKCQEKIPPSDQKQIFEEYWNLGEFNLRVMYIYERAY